MKRLLSQSLFSNSRLGLASVDGKYSNNLFIRGWKNKLVLVALLTVLIPMPGNARPMDETVRMGKPGSRVNKKCENIPLPQFLAAQGTKMQFFPPVKDYVGWADDDEVNFALVDYAGLANDYIKVQPNNQSLRTKVRGYVEKCATDNSNKAKITVFLSTTQALGFAQSIQALNSNNLDFDTTPTIFGSKAKDVVNGAEPAVGPATFLITFSIQKNAKLPDLLDVVNNQEEYGLEILSFNSITCGKKPDGASAHLIVNQQGSINSKINQFIFTTEVVKVVDGFNDACAP